MGLSAENVTNAHVFKLFYTLNLNAACVSVGLSADHTLFARVFRGVIRLIEMLLVSVGECIMCTCVCVGFIRLIEKLLVCLWDNVSFAQVLQWVSYAYLKCCLCVYGIMYYLQ